MPLMVTSPSRLQSVKELCISPSLGRSEAVCCILWPALFPVPFASGFAAVPWPGSLCAQAVMGSILEVRVLCLGLNKSFTLGLK